MCAVCIVTSAISVQPQMNLNVWVSKNNYRYHNDEWNVLIFYYSPWKTQQQVQVTKNRSQRIIYLLLHHSLLHLKLTNHQLFINGIHKTINLKKQIFIVRLSYALKIICHSQLAWLVLPWCYETKGYY